MERPARIGIETAIRIETAIAFCEGVLIYAAHEEEMILPNDATHRTKVTPGIWSTDDYIRRWARSHGMATGECIVPLQSLHDQWVARIDFDKQGEPVERMAAGASALCPA